MPEGLLKEVVKTEIRTMMKESVVQEKVGQIIAAAGLEQVPEITTLRFSPDPLWLTNRAQDIQKTRAPGEGRRKGGQEEDTTRAEVAGVKVDPATVGTGGRLRPEVDEIAEILEQVITHPHTALAHGQEASPVQDMAVGVAATSTAQGLG